MASSASDSDKRSGREYYGTSADFGEGVECHVIGL